MKKQRKQVALEAALETGVSVNRPYNGWHNYPTWLVSTTLSDGLTEELAERYEQERDYPEQTLADWAAAQLQEWYEAELEGANPSVRAMAQYAVELVDWRQLAETLVGVAPY